MSSESNEFDIGPIDELQNRNGWFAENWVLPNIETNNVPDELRQLIPLASRWGITCDASRADAAAKVTETDLAELRKCLSHTHALYEDWCFGATEPFDPNSTKCYIFGAMYCFESEVCGGPGIRSRLDWAINRFQNAPKAENRLYLQSALEWVVAKGQRFCRLRQTEIDIACSLLDHDSF